MKRLAGKHALVTGASTGIGRAVAVRFGREGARVAVNYPFASDRADAEATLALCPRGGVTEGEGHILVEADVSDEKQVEAMFDAAFAAFGSLDVLVNNAGILGACAESHETAVAEFDRVMGINLRGAFLCSRAAARH